MKASMLLLLYHDDEGRFVLKNDPGLPIAISSPLIPAEHQQDQSYLRDRSTTTSAMIPGLVATVTNKLHEDALLGGYVFVSNWYDYKTDHHCVLLRHSHPDATIYDDVEACIEHDRRVRQNALARDRKKAKDGGVWTQNDKNTLDRGRKNAFEKSWDQHDNAWTDNNHEDDVLDWEVSRRVKDCWTPDEYSETTAAPKYNVSKKAWERPPTPTNRAQWRWDDKCDDAWDGCRRQSETKREGNYW